ncbi:MAG TPA: hypothetical protein ENL03_06655, partial [Phycisphaerae bacterium]|nr:hypothetical protein [Phycisphaerae bacterium]
MELGLFCWPGPVMSLRAHYEHRKNTMKPLRVEEIRSIALGWRLSEGDDVIATGVSIDSRTAEAGDVFVAIKGDNFDGHDFLAQAAAAGCVAAIVHRDTQLPDDLARSLPGGVIGVNDTIKALEDIAASQRKSFGGSVVAVTGSNGKTTVKGMLDHILSSKLMGFASVK